MAVSSTSLKEKGDMLLSRATEQAGANQEKEPRGGEGKPVSAGPGRLSPPDV